MTELFILSKMTQLINKENIMILYIQIGKKNQKIKID